MRFFDRLPLPLLVLALPSVLAAQDAGSFEVVIDTKVSAMMMFVGNEDKLYIVDKAQGNAEQIKGHSAWGSVWDMNTNKVDVMDIQTNTFCSSGMHMPNGSYSVFGGNSAVRIGGDKADGDNWDSILQDFDGSKAIRILSPCTSDEEFSDSKCQWYDDPQNPSLQMQAQRWYSTAEPLADGTIVLMGGFTGGGFILRLYPNPDPTIGASLTYEYFPNTQKKTPQNLQFLFKTSGLNAYPHAFLMASGKMFLQANLSSTLWDHATNQETPLQDMPNGVVRVYPGSGATAMLPMTPANNWTQTVLFCGGSDMDDRSWGNFSFPFINTWDYPASKDCQRITPEGSGQYEQDDDMAEGRTMGQFIILPTGQLLVVNGGLNGTAGYGRNNALTPEGQMPFDQSFASGPVLTPGLYDPNAPKGSRWSSAGFQASEIPRLYHSSAILLPDGAVMLAGSNPNLDVNTTDAVHFKTEYRGEKFYPAYFAAKTRPKPEGVPKVLGYGGDAFDVKVPASSYEGKGNDAAKSAQVNVVRPGWTTHGMNMGQRFLQLENTYTVANDGTITLHVAQMPPNANLFQPGPAFVFVVINGIPSKGTHVIIGSGQIEEQPLSARTVLPQSVLASDDAAGSASTNTDADSKDGDSSGSSSNVGKIAAIAGAVGALAIAIVGLFVCLMRRRNSKIRAGIAAGKANRKPTLNLGDAGYKVAGAEVYAAVAPRSPGFGGYSAPVGDGDSQVFLTHKGSDAWSHSQRDSSVSGWDAPVQGYGAGYGDYPPMHSPPAAPYGYSPSHSANPSYSDFHNPSQSPPPGARYGP
ncbi:hypothetical protein MKEN_00162800 [Mycena kentingensis (nom. inval.)]|nr:hypothetical protein MKEN_00162800 [Mycena kentingensis (nom. inval.)]